MGLERKLLKAKGFYGVLAVATLIGLLLNFFGVDPIRALIGAAVVNGIVSIPLMAMLVHMSANEKVMGPLAISRRLQAAGWFTALVVTVAGVGFFFV